MIQKQKLIMWGSLLLLGCSSHSLVDQRVEDLIKKNAELRSSQQEQLRQIEELSNSLLVLQDRLETLKLAMEKKPMSSVAMVSEKSKKQEKQDEKEPIQKPELQNEVFNEDRSKTFLGLDDLTSDSVGKRKWTNQDLKGGKEPPSKSVIKARGEKAQKSERVVDDPQVTQSYTRAYQKFEQGKYSEAIQSLGQFVLQYPDHVYTDNAIFWMGESHYRMNDFHKALENFERLIKDYPTGNKVPDSLLRRGECLARLSRNEEAKRSYERLIQEYPQSVAAKEAIVFLSSNKEPGLKGRM